MFALAVERRRQYICITSMEYSKELLYLFIYEVRWFTGEQDILLPPRKTAWIIKHKV